MRQSPLYWSFPIGTWFMTQVRVSFWFPLIALVCLYKFGFAVGIAVTGLLFVSVLLHEFGHVFAARRTGGGGDEILIWPLGGLAFVRPAPNASARFMTAAAGPLMTLALCLIAVPAFWASSVSDQVIRDTFNPFFLPDVDVTNPKTVVAHLLILTFSLNWVLLLINLFPVHPMDGGRMLQAVLSSKLGNETSSEIYIRFGFIFAILMLIGGLIFDGETIPGMWLVFIGAVVLVLNMQEWFQHQVGESYDDSFMGYDFSQGYTSLERDGARAGEEPMRPHRPGPLQRWREKRRAEKERREEEKLAEVELQVDELLEKVHNNGIDSLTEAEKRQLKRASNEFRKKSDRAE